MPQVATRAGHVKVKSARRKKISSTKWLERQLNDPYVIASRHEGYRARSAYKLIQLNNQFNFIKRGQKILELGSAPGSWTQVNVNIAGKGNVFAVDIKEMEPVEGSKFLKLDIKDNDAKEKITDFLQSKVNVVLSDMASSSTGHSSTDHLRTMLLCEASFEIAKSVLFPGGSFVAKVIQGGTENKLLVELKNSFRIVKHAKPDSSRSASSELYVVAKNFRQFNT